MVTQTNNGRWGNTEIRPTKDLTGKRFGMLTVLERSVDRGNGRKPVVRWECRCDCGKVFTVNAASLLSGHTISCGCRKVKHGHCNRHKPRERLYETWCNMRKRCNNLANKRWENYGGKGVKVCAEWDDYEIFREWALSHGYADNLTIDRIDVNGDYCPENCRFADAKIQSNNTTRNIYVEYDGKTYTLSTLADYLGYTYSTIKHRYDRGWSIERIASQPPRCRPNR